MVVMVRILEHDEAVKSWRAFAARRDAREPREDLPVRLLYGWLDDSLSLWRIESNQNLQHVLVAFCRLRQGWKKIAYLKFDEQALIKAELIVKKSNGKTGDVAVDMSGMHREVEDFTVRKALGLLLAVVTSNFDVGEFTYKEFADVVYGGYVQSRQAKPVVSSIGVTREQMEAKMAASSLSAEPAIPPNMLVPGVSTQSATAVGGQAALDNPETKLPHIPDS